MSVLDLVPSTPSGGYIMDIMPCYRPSDMRAISETQAWRLHSQFALESIASVKDPWNWDDKDLLYHCTEVRPTSVERHSQSP